MREPGEASGTSFWGERDDAEALQYYRTLVNTVDDGIYQLDENGRFVAVNDIIVEMTGYSREELVGEHVSLLLEDDDITRIAEEIHSRLTTGESHTETFEFTVRTTDGESIGCELQFNLLLDEGTFQGTVGIVRDITDRKRAEQRLRKREQQLQRERDLTDQLLETSPVGIQVFDEDGEVIRMNERAKELLDVDDVDTYSPADRRTYDEDGTLIEVEEHPFTRTLATGTSVYDEILQVELPDGSRRWLSVNATPVLTDDGEINRVVAAGEDITDLKEREQRLERRKSELETELSEVLGRISDAFYALDEDWRFTHINEQAARLLQRSREELLEKRLWEIFPDAVETIVWDRLHEAMDSQDPVSFEMKYESLDAWVEVNAYPSETGLSVYFREITERVERERELERYRTIVETVNDGIYTVDPDGTFTMVNETYAEMTKHSREELVGSDVSLVIDEETAESAQTLEEELASGEREQVMLEADVQTADGELIPAEATFALLPTSDPAEHGRVGVVRDITARRRAEEELRKSEERFRTMMEQSPFSMQIFDAEGWAITANPAWERLWDAPRDELADYNILEDEQLKDAGLMPHIRDAFAGESVTLPVTHYDPGEIGKQGRDRWIEGYVYPLLPGSGETFEVAVVHVDITERKERELELERYEMAVETVWDGITILDSDERFVLVNEAFCEMTGYDREEIIGEHASLILDESAYEQAGELYDEVAEGDRDTATLEYDLLAADGGTVPVEARFGLVEYADGTVGGAGVIRDISERKQREQQLEELVDRLEESNERLEQFAYAASHDLQEPLRMVTSYLTLIEQRYGDALDEDGQEFLEFAVDGAERMREMIQGLLQYSRVDAQGEPLEPVGLDDVLRDVRDDLQMKIDENDAVIIGDELPSVKGDAGQLRQLFQNLLDNAIEYSGDEPPHVEIEAEREADEWVFRVADDGIGIDPDQVDRIFEVFRRLHTNEEHPGVGIGLTVCQRIVERHGGEIWVESEPGEGATFLFTIPVPETEQ